VGVDRPQSATVAPFFTPASGAVRSNVGMVAFEGDAGLTGDSLTFNGVAAADALNPADNVFNSTVSANGASVTTRNPSYANTLGLDLDTTTGTGLLANGQSSAALAMSSTSESFYVSAFYLVSDEGPAVNTARPAVTGTARDGSELSATTGAWNGTPSIDYAFAWQRCDASGTDCQAIPGAVGSTYTLNGADVDSTVRAVVTASNDAGASAPAASAVTATVGKRPPANATLPAISGTPRDGRELSTTLGTWTGSGPLDYAVRWLRCDTGGANCVAIANATDTRYTATADDIGHTLRSEVTASNSAGQATASSPPTGEVTAAPPALAGAPTVTGIARERETLTATTGAWTGTAPISFAYQWERCAADGTGCGAIGAATGATYVLTPADVGHRVRVAVTARNAGGSAIGRSVASNAVAAAVARNTVAPTVTGPDATRILTAHAGSWEGTLGPITYQWQRCSASGDACADLPGATRATYTLAEADGGRTVRVAVTMTNAAGPATALSAVTARLPFPRPVNLVPPSIAGSAVRGAVLTARPGAWRALGTPVSSFRWQRCDADGETCAPIAGADASKYTAAAGDLGRTLRVAVTVTNDGGSATATSDATAAIVEPPVVAPDPVVTPAPVSTGGVAGTTDSKPVPAVASVPGSLVADASCQVLHGAPSQQATLPGIGVVVVRAAARGPATAATPMRLTTTGGRAASVRYVLDGRPLATGRRANVAPARIGAPGRHTVTVMLRTRTGVDQTIALPLRTSACSSRFTGRRSKSGLRLRVDARTALTDITFTVPAKLLPRQTGAARPVGTLRLLVAGDAAPRTVGLVLPAKGTAPQLLGVPSVRYTARGLLVSGLPPGTAAVELVLTRAAALDGAAPRGAITLHAKVRRDGAAARTLTLRTR
jgi:hypothetical protein